MHEYSKCYNNLIYQEKLVVLHLPPIIVESVENLRKKIIILNFCIKIKISRWKIKKSKVPKIEKKNKNKRKI